MTPLLITIANARVRWACGRTRLYDLIKEGKLLARKNGARTLLDVAVGDAYFASLPLMKSRGRSNSERVAERAADRRSNLADKA